MSTVDLHWACLLPTHGSLPHILLGHGEVTGSVLFLAEAGGFLLRDESRLLNRGLLPIEATDQVSYRSWASPSD